MGMKYKIRNSGGVEDILNLELNISIPKDPNNTDYQQFLQDYIGIGTTCVEGATVGVTTAYDIARKAEYPSIEDQLDKIYHSGVNAWKADIKVIKDKYPKTQVGVTTIAAIPSWVETEAVDIRKSNYLKAVERLKKPRLKLGTPYVETNWDQSQNKYIEVTKYKDVPAADDPRVIGDEAERDAAQAVIDGTPQSIIDSINT
mgnify:CR=1 FL=1